MSYATITNTPGTMLISLDFELYWGVLESKTLRAYTPNLAGVPDAVTAMLQLFEQHKIHTTWATVGLLYCVDRDDTLKQSPALRPSYNNKAVDPYRYIDRHTSLPAEYHFALNLINKIACTQHQEIATHTFSHYFCKEPGQTKEEFLSDLKRAQLLAQEHGHNITSIVFPRNQVNAAYSSVLSDVGITSYRGVENHWAYDPDPLTAKTRKCRLYRLMDSYVNLSGYHTHKLPKPEQGLINLRASRFLRPYSERLRWLDRLKLRRIKRAMTSAAQRGEIFHLWWHPHNFGTHLTENIHMLNSIIDHFNTLSERYGMRSLTMNEVASEALTLSRDEQAREIHK